METYKKVVIAGLFVFASTGAMMAMENNPEQDGETTPRDQVNTDKKILAQRFADENTLATTSTYPVTVIPYQYQKSQEDAQQQVITGSELDLIVSALKQMAQNQFLNT